MKTDDEPDWVQLAAQHRQFERYRLEQLVAMAKSNGVVLTLPSQDDYPMTLVYQPPNPNWYVVHLRLLGDGWRISEVDTPMTYGRNWRYGKGDGAFMRAVSAIAVWQGHPRSAPPGALREG